MTCVCEIYNITNPSGEREYLQCPQRVKDFQAFSIFVTQLQVYQLKKLQGVSKRW